MNWEAVSAISNILGAVAVVISLAYLAMQVRMNSNELQQNSRHIEASTYRETNTAFLDWFGLLADRDTASVWAKVLAGAPLDETDKVRTNALLSILFLSFENYFQQERLGGVSRKTFTLPTIAGLFAVPTISDWWDAQAPRIFTPEFRETIEALRQTRANPVPD
ncbi:MAG: hypothetical protein Q8R02_15175 [Hyphomonadaceae bacterium]|nr:hypothetical protein [Hyphomonadaceae bacterium]